MLTLSIFMICQWYSYYLKKINYCYKYSFCVEKFSSPGSQMQTTNGYRYWGPQECCHTGGGRECYTRYDCSVLHCHEWVCLPRHTAKHCQKVKIV